MSDEYLTTEQTAVYLGCSPATVTRLVRRGHFPGTRKMDPTRRNSGLRIPREAVENFRKLQVVTPEELKQS